MSKNITVPALLPVLLNGKPFKVVGNLAITSDGKAVALEDKPAQGKYL